MHRSAELLRVPAGRPTRAAEIARRSRGTPRIVNRLLRRVRDFAQVRADGRVTQAVAQAALELYEVDELGLDRLDRGVLEAICRRFGGGPVGLSTLAISVGEERETVEEVAEPFLVRQGFLMRTAAGPGGHPGRLATPRHCPVTGARRPVRGFRLRVGRVRRSGPHGHALARPNAAPRPNAGAMDQYSTLILIALMVVAFYFLIMRPQTKRQQEIQRTMSALTPGQRVMLGSGLFGTVVSVGEKQVVLEISPGIELTVLKQAIARVVDRGDEDGAVDETDLDDATTRSSSPRARCRSSRSRSGRERRPGAAGHRRRDQRPTTAG